MKNINFFEVSFHEPMRITTLLTDKKASLGKRPYSKQKGLLIKTFFALKVCYLVFLDIDSEDFQGF